MTLRVLLVDDSEEFRLLAAQFIAIEWPDAVVDEWDPQARGEIAMAHPLGGYDAMLLDYVLGGSAGDGLDWLQRLLPRDDCPPVVMLTGAGSETVAFRAMKLGAFDYLPKHELSKTRLAEVLRAAAAERSSHAPGSRAPRARLDETLQISGRFQLSNPSGPTQEVEINGYRVIEKIGAGGMSTVYLAERVADGLRLALKIMDARLSEDEEFLKRFIQEHGVVSGLDSPQVMRIFDQGFTDRHIYIAMEHFPGGDLRARIREGLAPEAALAILRQVAAALAAIHAQGIVHRDLKPENVMFRADASAAIVDFGIAKKPGASADLTAHGDVLGTPHYLSPEQACAQPLDGRSDLYSVGILLFEMLTGLRPFNAEDAIEIALKHVHEPLPRMPEALEAYQELIDCLTAKRRDDRFAGAADLVAYLDRRWPVRKAPVELIDVARLEKLRADFAGRPGFFEKALAAFAAGTERQMVELARYESEGDARALERGAHTLKGGASAYGAPRLAALAGELEKRVRSGHPQGVAHLVREAAACARETLARLTEFRGAGL